MTKILLVQPQEDLGVAMRDWFLREGFLVELLVNGRDALQWLREHECDAIVIELALPGLDGALVIRRYRAAGGCTPVLLLVPRLSPAEIEQCLEAGADAYMEQPYHLRIVTARVRALLRRPNLKSSKLCVGDVQVDSVSRTVSKEGVIIHLHPMEFRLLEFLVRHPNEVFSAKTLLDRVWPDRYDDRLEDTVRTTVKTLRLKIDKVGLVSLITTVRGFGYKINLPELE